MANSPSTTAEPTALKLLRLQLRVQAAFSTEWAFRTAWRVFTTPQRIPPKPWEEAALADARRFTVTSAGTAIAAYEWNPAGSRTVLLVHGWEHRASFWGAMAAGLAAAGYRVVALDGPAHGASGGTRTTLPAFARAVAAVAATLEPVYAVVAHSFGAAATVGVPVRVNQHTDGYLPRLVLLAAPATTAQVAQRFAQLLRLPPAVLARMERYVQQQEGRDSESFSLTQVGHQFPARRALLLHDHHDASIPFAEATQIAASWPALQLRSTTGLGHNRIMRDAEVIRQVVDFLQ